VHVFPFRMDSGWEQQHQDSEWLPFWRELAPAYSAFAQNGRPPRVSVKDRRYVVVEP